EDFNAMAHVARRIGRNEYRLDAIIFDQLLKRWVRFRAAANFCQLLTAVGEQIANRDDFDVRVILETEFSAKLADAIADDSDSNFAIGHWLPTFGNIRVLGRLFEPLDWFLFRAGRLR